MHNKDKTIKTTLRAYAGNFYRERTALKFQLQDSCAGITQRNGRDHPSTCQLVPHMYDSRNRYLLLEMKNTNRQYR